MRDGLPQFSTAEYAGKAAWTCTACRNTIDGAHYRINGQTVCESCAQAVKQQLPTDSHVALVCALLAGIGGAALGAALYVVVALVTGLVIGFVSLAVGFIVGKAMLLGSGGVRGRRYQILAAILTYLAVSLSAVPIALYHLQAQSASLHLGRAVAALALAGLASPFLDLHDPLHGLIALVILFVGVRIAWRLLRAPTVNIEGPLTDPPPAIAPI